MPSLYIIAGSNGAGKSTFGSIYVPKDVLNGVPIFDGDKLFVEKRNELWNSGIRSPKEARNLAYEFVTNTFDELVEKAITAKSNFVYEGHFTNDATWDIPKRFKEDGFDVNMVFFGLKDVDISELRVLDRVKEGGHFVDRLTIESNFYGNLEKLNQYYHLIDNLLIVDTTVDHMVVAHIIEGKCRLSLHRDQLPTWVTQYLPRISALIP
ncbi:MAG TPA: zeta toxin family protein [Puia sp.]|nr:zeta toxin family protein [Puia sp.]